MFQFEKWRLYGHVFLNRLYALLAPAAAPVFDFPFVPSDVALLQRGTLGADDVAIDDQTWDDMLLDDYAGQLAPGVSIFGQQVLHRRLRNGDGACAERLRPLLRDAPARQLLERSCRDLGRADVEVSALLFAPAGAAAPAWSRHLSLLPLALALSAGAALLLSWLVWPLVGLLWLALMGLQSHFYESAKEWQRSVRALQLLLRAHSLLGRLDVAPAQGMRDGGARADKLGRAIGRATLAEVPGLGDYRDWVLLDNIKHYFKSRELVRANLDFLRQSYLLVANLEADLALARHLSGAPRFCWAERGACDAVAFEQMVHPLLERAAPLSIALHGKGAFISGQNGVGKSTLLRSVGLNLIVARAFGFCYARSAVAPLAPVYSSMQGEDSLAGGESLYLAELRRAKELLALADGPRPAVFIIDEIFRGTNHLESISAAAAVLHTLAARGLVIVSSHNLVLAPLLQDCLAPWCVGAADGEPARLTLAPGVLARPNGIALLAQRGFGAPIEAKAGKVRDWLSAYLAHPGECADVLAPQAESRGQSPMPLSEGFS